MKERILAYKTAGRTLTQKEIEEISGGDGPTGGDGPAGNGGIGTAASPDSFSGDPEAVDDCGSDWG